MLADVNKQEVARTYEGCGHAGSVLWIWWSCSGSGKYSLSRVLEVDENCLRDGCGWMVRWRPGELVRTPCCEKLATALES